MIATTEVELRAILKFAHRDWEQDPMQQIREQQIFDKIMRRLDRFEKRARRASRMRRKQRRGWA